MMQQVQQIAVCVWFQIYYYHWPVTCQTVSYETCQMIMSFNENACSDDGVTGDTNLMKGVLALDITA